MSQPYDLETIKEQVLTQIRNFATDIEDPTLRQEADRAIKSLENYVGVPEQFLASANEILSNLIILVGEYDKRRTDLRALYADLDDIQQSAATPEGLVEILSCLDYSEARKTAIELIQTTSLLAQLSRGVFIGENGEKIKEQARSVFRDLLSIEKGQFQHDIATLFGLGGAKILRMIRRDPSGRELRRMIQDEQISYSAIVAVAKRIVIGLQQEILTPLLKETEREMNEGLIAYIVPRDERHHDDPLIRKLAKYVDPYILIRSRLATPIERRLKRKAVPVIGELLQLSDDLTRLLNLLSSKLKPKDRKKYSNSINNIKALVGAAQKTTVLLDLSVLDNAAETERQFLQLLLNQMFLFELRTRISIVYGQLSQENPLSKERSKFLEKEIISYVDEFTLYINDTTIKGLQTNLSVWRNWLYRIEDKYQINENQMRPYLQFAPDRFIAMEKIIQQPKRINKHISILKRRKRLSAIEKRGKNSEVALIKLKDLFEYLEKQFEF